VNLGAQGYIAACLMYPPNRFGPNNLALMPFL
jgi:hypothetical protein